MGIFSFLNPTANKKLNDLRLAQCPYCEKKLDKVPGSKTKCPHCGKYMYVRTRPKDNAKVVVTELDARQIEEDWSIVNGTHDEYIAEQKKVNDKTALLRKRFGEEPSTGDVNWGIMNDNLSEHAINGNWGFYRNTRLEMAELLKKEQKLKHSLQAYLEVCYLDFNGPNNIGRNNGLDIGIKSFEPKYFTSFAPGLIKIILKIISNIGISEAEIKKDFIEHNLKIQNALKLPISPEECWSRLQKEIIIES